VKQLFRSPVGSQHGFTVIELAVVLGILVVLAAIIIPNMSGLIGTGKPEAAKAELAAVQKAMDDMRAQKNLATVTPQATPTKDMTQFPPGAPLFPSYYFISLTKGKYTCSENGQVTQVITGY